MRPRVDISKPLPAPITAIRRFFFCFLLELITSTSFVVSFSSLLTRCAGFDVDDDTDAISAVVVADERMSVVVELYGGAYDSRPIVIPSMVILKIFRIIIICRRRWTIVVEDFVFVGFFLLLLYFLLP